MTEIKPSYIRAFCVTFIVSFLLGSIVLPAWLYLMGDPFSIERCIAMGIVCGFLLGGFGTFMFTPWKIKWNEEKMKIHCLFPGTSEHKWDELQAYSVSGMRVGTFRIKFSGKQAYQINPAGFKKTEWNQLVRLLRCEFPDKRRSIWLGPIPIK